MKDLTGRELAGWRLLLILLFLDMLICGYFGHVGWMLFWAIAFGSCAHECGYEYGKTEERLSNRSDQRCGVVAVNQ
jgi:hypothetical protein